MPTILIVNLCVVTALVFVIWLLSLRLRDASIIDPFWGFGFVVIAGVTFFQFAGEGNRPPVLFAMVALWGLRLSAFLLWRNFGHGEDRRYASMRKFHGTRFWWRSLFTVFLFQALIMWFVAFPIQFAIPQSSSLSAIDVFGIALWFVGLVFESVGDFQMSRFRANPDNAGKVLDRGLWRFTRHPNYFGDFCVWWGIFIVSAGGGAWYTALSPLLMSFLLLKVSGVAMLERDIADRRPEYENYIRQTNAFFPGPPKRQVDRRNRPVNEGVHFW